MVQISEIILAQHVLAHIQCFGSQILLQHAHAHLLGRREPAAVVDAVELAARRRPWRLVVADEARECVMRREAPRGRSATRDGGAVRRRRVALVGPNSISPCATRRARPHAHDWLISAPRRHSRTRRGSSCSGLCTPFHCITLHYIAYLDADPGRAAAPVAPLADDVAVVAVIVAIVVAVIVVVVVAVVVVAVVVVAVAVGVVVALAPPHVAQRAPPPPPPLASRPRARRFGSGGCAAERAAVVKADRRLAKKSAAPCAARDAVVTLSRWRGAETRSFRAASLRTAELSRGEKAREIPLHCMFHSIPSHPIPFHSVPFHSIPFQGGIRMSHARHL